MGLTTFNEKLVTVAGAAGKLENADATALTFTVQKDLKYSDGSLLNAARFVYALKRNINPETAGKYASITDEIMGAPEWRNADTAAADYDATTCESSLGIAVAQPDGAGCGENPHGDADCLILKLILSKPAPLLCRASNRSPRLPSLRIRTIGVRRARSTSSSPTALA